MRHRDPKLTANLYTDVTRLPTFEAVKSLNWHDKRERKNQPHDTHIDPQNPDTEGLPQSRTDKQSADDTDMESDDSAPDSPNLARPETGGQKVEVAGVEPACPEVLDRASTDIVCFLILGMRREQTRFSPPSYLLDTATGPLTRPALCLLAYALNL